LADNRLRRWTRFAKSAFASLQQEEGSTMQIAGLAAIVTGGGSGLGAATAQALAKAGAKVALFDRNIAAAASVAAEIGGLAGRYGAAYPELVSDRAQLAAIDAALADETGRELASARAAVDSARAALARAHADHDRLKKVDPRATTQTQVDASTESELTAQAQLADAQAKQRTAELVQDNIDAAQAQVKQLEAQVAAAQADLEQTEINLGYTKLIAPFDGWVTKRNVEQGSYVQVGQSLFTLVSPDVWVTANFKEAQLADMRPGQKVKIDLDAFPNLKIEGHVDSIQMGSGSRFTAFPAENATGNYVKIVQRVPVKIVIDKGLEKDQALPLGLSVVPTVTTK